MFVSNRSNIYLIGYEELAVPIDKYSFKKTLISFSNVNIQPLIVYHLLNYFSIFSQL